MFLKDMSCLDTEMEWSKFERDQAQLSALEAAVQLDAETIEVRGGGSTFFVQRAVNVAHCAERMRSALMTRGWSLSDKCSTSLQLGLVRLRELQELQEVEEGLPAGPGSVAVFSETSEREMTLWALLAPSRAHTADAMEVAHSLKVTVMKQRCDIERATFAGDPAMDELMQQLPSLLKSCNVAEVAFSLALHKEKALLADYLYVNRSAMNTLLAELALRIRALQRLIRRETSWMEIASETSKELALTLEAGKRRTHALELVEATGKALRDAKLKLERVTIDAKLQPHTVTEGVCVLRFVSLSLTSASAS
jgi:hypothetical protein